MEIISILLSGDLRHRDSMGNEKTIKEGEIQVMSAGSGVTHSEFNPNKDKEVKFLQIWIIPNERDVTPRYDQQQLPDLDQKNILHQVLSPSDDDAGVWIHQNAWFHMGRFDVLEEAHYQWKSEKNGLYAFVLEGGFEFGEHQLDQRDALGIWDTNNISLKATSPESRILLIEVPLGN
jgi:redox-sensitive bicupin YhaK (pirin superfamily)